MPVRRGTLSSSRANFAQRRIPSSSLPKRQRIYGSLFGVARAEEREASWRSILATEGTDHVDCLDLGSLQGDERVAWRPRVNCRLHWGVSVTNQASIYLPDDLTSALDELDLTETSTTADAERALGVSGIVHFHRSMQAHTAVLYTGRLVSL